MTIIDANLPIFHLIPSRTSPSHECTVAQSQDDCVPSPKYLKRRDPTRLDTYSIALHDSHYPEIVYASVTTSAIYPPLNAPPSSKSRKSSSTPANLVPPPPEPKVPLQITMSLHNPDSRVTLTQKPSSWASGPYWEFSLPKTSFLEPTGSKLDVDLDVTKRILSTVPLATFRWRKEGGVLSKSSLRCSLIHPSNITRLDEFSGGSASDSHGRKKVSGSGSSEPDITVAIFSNGINAGKSAGRGEITIFEPHLNRVEVEDRKGLEVTLVMTAMAIADIYFGDMRTGFNLGPRAPQNFTGPGRTASITQQQQLDIVSTEEHNLTPLRAGSVAPPPYTGAAPTGFMGDTKVRHTQEQLWSPEFQHQLQEEDRRRQEAAARAEREARKAALLAQQEAEARRLQMEFEMEAAREIARIDAETRTLRAQFQLETREMEIQQAGRGSGIGGSAMNSRSRGASGRLRSFQPPNVLAAPPRDSSQGTMSTTNRPLQQPRPPNIQPNTLQPPKLGWFGGKTLDANKDRRKSFFGGLRASKENDESLHRPTDKGKGKGKLSKKKSWMW